MKKKLFALLLLVQNCALSAQVPVDSFFSYIREHSVYRHAVDWAIIEKDFREDLAQAASPADTARCFVNIFEALGDYHSHFSLNGVYYGHYPTFDDTTLARLSPMVLKSREIVNAVYATAITDSIAYIRIPGIQAYGQEDIDRHAQAIFDAVAQFPPESMKGVIIDLRLNGGGNIYPMLTGLGNFLDNSTVAYEVDHNQAVVREWKIENRIFTIGGYASSSLALKPDKKLNGIRVAVLIGPVTLSSGSMVAIAFKNRPNTLIFGEPTAEGYTTSNGYFQLAPDLSGNLASFYVADRNKTVYQRAVPPDIFLYGGDNFDNLLEDKKIEAALAWLRE